MEETWKKIRNFDYEVSDFGHVRSRKSGRVLRNSVNQFGVVYVGMMQDGEQKHRSVALLVATAFIPRKFPAFNTPINLNGDRFNNHTDNLEWRPRRYAVLYNRQFREPYPWPIRARIEDIHSGEVSENSFDCATRYGLLERDVVLSILNRTYAWPTYQEFRVITD